MLSYMKNTNRLIEHMGQVVYEEIVRLFTLFIGFLCVSGPLILVNIQLTTWMRIDGW